MEKKLQYFLENIQVHAQRDLDDLAGTVSESQRQAIQEAKAHAKAAAERYKSTELAQLRNVGQVQVDARQAENRRRLLEQRQAWGAEVTRQVVQKVRDYAAGKEYPARLESLLSQALDALGRDGSTVVYLRREDMSLAERLQKKERGVQLSFREGDFVLGGLIGLSEKTCRRADLSFDTALEEAQARFSELAGLELD